MLKKLFVKIRNKWFIYYQINIYKQGLLIDDIFTDIQSYCQFDDNFIKSDEKILFYINNNSNFNNINNSNYNIEESTKSSLFYSKRILTELQKCELLEEI